MADIERSIGRLEGKFDEFSFYVKQELKDIKRDVKSLQRFKWRTAGGMAVIIAVIETIHIFYGA